MLDPDHTPSERYAANELAGHVARITGAVLPVRVLDYDDLPSVGRAVLVGKGAWLDKRRFVESREALGVLGDDETLAHYRRYAVIHTLLFPYFVSLLPDAVDRGLPLTRHPYLVEPEARSLWTGDGYEVFLGDDLLVAPVLEQGAASRTVFLPAAGWWPLFGDAPIEGAGGDADTVEVEVDAPPTEIPVFVRPGTALPLLAEPVDSFYGAAADDVTTLADVEERHRVALYPDAAGSIRTTRVGSGTVSGDGWWPAPNGTPTVDDVALGPCDGAEDDESCWDEGAGLVRIVGAAASLAWNEATLEVSGDHEQTLVVGVAADAWGDLAEPTVLTDLDPDIPPPCEEE